MNLDSKEYDITRYENKIDQDSKVRLVWSSFMLDIVSMISV
jgi:hypothetical protein